ncbi:hypothetical protein MJ579_17145 [Klebsiella pneumoniae]|nr:hypothetical protein MJ579_17145 [Klebsiella pneumoniae]
MLTMVAVISAAVVKDQAHARHSNPSEGGGIVAEVGCDPAPGRLQADRQTREHHRDDQLEFGQRTPLKLPSSQNITSRACCAAGGC